MTFGMEQKMALNEFSGIRDQNNSKASSPKPSNPTLYGLSRRPYLRTSPNPLKVSIVHNKKEKKDMKFNAAYNQAINDYHSNLKKLIDEV
jgi:hypothetical protein